MRQSLSLNHGQAYLLVLLAIALLGWGVWATIDALRPPESLNVRLAAGSAVARRYQIAESFACEARRRDLFIEVASTSGFEESAQRLASGELDLALVSSGLECPESDELRILAGLDIAPLHVLARRELVAQGLPFHELVEGKRVNVGPEGTNDYLLASDVMQYIRPPRSGSSDQLDYTPTALSKEQLNLLAQRAQSKDSRERQSSLAELPDVIMTVATLPGMLVQELLNTGEFCLIPFENLEPYLLTDLHHVNRPEGSLDRILVEPTVIHAGMYLGKSKMPPRDCLTVGLRTLLVARADLPVATAKRAMECIFETDFMRRANPRNPREFATAYKIHPGAEMYLDRDKPLLAGNVFEAIGSFLSIFGAFSAGALSFYGYLRRRRIRRPGEYFEEIRKIDALASGKQIEAEAHATRESNALELDTRLNELKEQVIRDYCDNRVQGEMVVLSILSMLSDTRSRLQLTQGRATASKATASAPLAVRRTDEEISHRAA